MVDSTTTTVGVKSNHEFIRRFEADQFQVNTVPEDSFHHADHVRLAFAYLREHPPLQALEKFAAALKRYAAARGKPDRYHETITHAYFFLIRERMARSSVCSSALSCADSSPNDWEEFSRRNPDLLIWKNGILTRYYEESTLQSTLARNVFLFPDKFRSSDSFILEPLER